MRHNGFTLIELLIAIAIFSVISLAAYTLLNTVLKTKRSTEKVELFQDVIQRASMILKKETSQIVDRPIRNEYGKMEPALQTEKGRVVFTKSGWANPMSLRRSTLQRVGYSFENGQLIRYYWPVLDRTTETPMRRQVLIKEGVMNVSWRFLNRQKQWKLTWPPKTANTKVSTQDTASMAKNKRSAETNMSILPRAVEITISLKEGTFQIISQLSSYEGKLISENLDKEKPEGLYGG